MTSRNASNFWDSGPSGADGDSIVRMVPRRPWLKADAVAPWSQAVERTSII